MFFSFKMNIKFTSRLWSFFFNSSLLMGITFPPVIQMYTKFAKFARLYFPHFVTFYHQNLQFY